MYTALNNLKVRVRPYTCWYKIVQNYQYLDQKNHKVGDISTNFGFWTLLFLRWPERIGADHISLG